MGTVESAVEQSRGGSAASSAIATSASPVAPTTDAPAEPVVEPAVGAQAIERAAEPQMVDRARAETFGQAFAVLLARHGYYDDATQTHQLAAFYERLRQQNGRGIRIAALRSYLQGEALPSAGKARLIADALGAPRALVLYVAGYLTPGDLAHYPGPQMTVEAVEADIAELAELPLSPETRRRIVHDLRVSARILGLLASSADDVAETERSGATTLYVAAPDERETLIERLIELWSAQTPQA